jgi:hypothetical protein
MATFGELSGLKQWAVVVGGAVLVTAGMHYTVFKSQRDRTPKPSKSWKRR